ncbi:hypothetical protein A374_07021 [Fictibacillus macauensis ZFHKF-1]|uniref:Uncharacterized protein n=1 Tax=Fictibacillus macauensis ZFHKF-1 TaxID=1196324 RepID=I8AJT4_9BACL|nr:hypothetical protein [Fictibacillus macauensis]EIT86052.1 hypothetical protein A374_07021 [Fictibacillus macauensis ZFHKF-1]
MLKKLMSFGVLLGILLFSMNTAHASSNTYHSTYSLKGSMSSRMVYVTSTPTFMVTTTPTLGAKGSGLILSLHKRTATSDVEVDRKTVSSQGKETTVFFKKGSGAGNYYFVFKNSSGKQMKGAVDISYNW